VEHPGAEGDANSCLDCHEGLGGDNAQVVEDWQSSIHAERGITCADCHGGDLNADDRAAAMSAQAGFVGVPDRTEIPDLCGSCHADVVLMRQYGLPTDQLAQYRESFHGQQLSEGDIKVATCWDCHDEHATPETNDPSASVYRTNVPQLCARCHADEAYMAEYDIPTDQYDLYRESVHGIALLDHQDIRAPNCADCHGTHGAAPPGFAEVSNVCGSCHSATQDYYLDSAHSSENPDAPRCVTCHGRYDVQQPSEAMFLGAEPRQCGSCHDPDSETGRMVGKLYQALADADASLTEAREAVDQASSLGMIVAEEENLLTEARTRLITARAAQHTVDLATVEQETRAAVDLSVQAREQAEAAIAENRFRRQAMVIALAINAVVIFSLVMVRRELAGRH
jgi:predicted CXXCH cytochrome family protein